jgi:hypothetical protein
MGDAIHCEIALAGLVPATHEFFLFAPFQKGGQRGTHSWMRGPSPRNAPWGGDG